MAATQTTRRNSVTWLRGLCGAGTRAGRVPTPRDAFRAGSKERPEESGRGRLRVRLRVCATSVAEKLFLRGNLWHQAVHHLEHVAMRQDGGGVALHDIEIGAGEADAIFRRGEQDARLGDRTLGVLLGDRKSTR